ncbi:MAG: AraC family transcriptional regulator [Lachnospiraceae bacterium]|nr:AraC family transcriptional regulator [Lachnospiraceae bacterium]
MKYALFPVLGKERELPLFNVSIGVNEYQYHVVRPEGYWYDQFIYSAHGTGMLIVDGKSTKITPNTVFFLPRNTPHEYYSLTADWDTRWLTPAGFALDTLLAQLGFHGVTLMTVRDISTLDAILERMRGLLFSNRVSGNYYASAYVYEFIMELHRLTHESSQKTNTSSSTRLLPIIEYIDLHFADTITLEDLSAIIQVTPQHLCRLFRDNLGMRPLEYISQKRVRAAQDYLASSELSIAEIATHCGYDNMNYFYRMFRKYTGITPGAYRTSLHR